ncbi:hypothetical protein FGB62_182g144 [Gracilaria domingensis]|nr:hypothetical protein FGB62_182g144 [Gracilaria domingensis]
MVALAAPTQLRAPVEHELEPAAFAHAVAPAPVQLAVAPDDAVLQQAHAAHHALAAHKHAQPGALVGLRDEDLQRTCHGAAAHAIICRRFAALWRRRAWRGAAGARLQLRWSLRRAQGAVKVITGLALRLAVEAFMK